MVQVTKQTVQQWVMIDYLAKKHRYQANVSAFERKYNMSLDEFEKHFETSEKEVFEEWDDYIDWKADYEFLQTVNKKIEDIKSGNIEYIG